MSPDEIKSIVELLLDFIRNTGEVVLTAGFQAVYKKTIFDGVFLTVLGGIVFLLSILLVRESYLSFNKEDVSDDGAIMGAFTVFMFLIITIVFLHTGLSRLIAPEYHTVLKMIDLIK